MSYFNSTVYDCLLGIRFGKDEKNRLTDNIKFRRIFDSKESDRSVREFMVISNFIKSKIGKLIIYWFSR